MCLVLQDRQVALVAAVALMHTCIMNDKLGGCLWGPAVVWLHAAGSVSCQCVVFSCNGHAQCTRCPVIHTRIMNEGVTAACKVRLQLLQQQLLAVAVVPATALGSSAPDASSC
jgi:hypothetical protein